MAGDLAPRGWPGSRIDKLLGANFARLFAEVWDAPSVAAPRVATPDAVGPGAVAPHAQRGS